MGAERTTIAAPYLRMRSPLELLMGLRRSSHAVRTNLRARAYQLETERAGRLTYYSNVDDFARLSERPLVLLHGVHPGSSAHELDGVFEALRGERPIYALDLPGFGCSEHGLPDYRPEVYVSAIARLLELAARNAASPDVLAVGLTSEYVARVAVELPDLVHSLTLISPTGFAVKREQDSFERASRRGKALLPVRLASKLGLSPLLYRALLTERSIRYLLRRAASSALDLRDDVVRYCSATRHEPGAEHAAVAYLSGALHPAGNPQSVYTRVHSPTLILYADEPKPRYGSLDSFVKWHEYFSAEKLDNSDLSLVAGADQAVLKMRRFWDAVKERDLAEAQTGVLRTDSDGEPSKDVAAVSSY